MCNEVGNTLKPSTRIHKPEKPIEMDFLNQLEVPNWGKTEWLHSYWAQWTFLPFYDTVWGGRCTPYASAVRLCQDHSLTPVHSLRDWGVRADWQHLLWSPPPLSSVSHSSLSRSFLNKCLYPTLCLSLSPCVPASPHSNCLMPLFVASCSQIQMYNRADAHIALFIFAQEGDRKPMRGRERFVLITCIVHHWSHNEAAAIHSAVFDGIPALLVTWWYGIPELLGIFAAGYIPADHRQPFKGQISTQA